MTHWEAVIGERVILALAEFYKIVLPGEAAGLLFVFTKVMPEKLECRLPIPVSAGNKKDN